MVTEEFGQGDDGKIYRKAGDTEIKASDEESREAEEIVFRAKSDGSYMKAPNGEATKLSKSQWVQVRTRAFKDWFGDWEKVSRIEKLRNSAPIEISGREIEPSEDLKQYKKNALNYGKELQGFYTNKDTGTTIHLQRGRKNGGINEVLQHDYKNVQHLQSVAAIPEIIENSIFIEHRNNRDVDKNPNVSEYHYYICGLKIGTVDYTVRSVIAVDKGGNRYYDHKLTEIEKTKLLDQINSQAVNSNGFGSTPSLKLTTDYFVKDTKLVSLLQVNSSKLLDINGEPKAEDISKFESEKGDTMYRSGEFSPASDAEIGEAVRIGKSLGMEVEVVNEPSSENAGYYDTKTGQVVVNSATGGEACLVIYMTSLGARLKRRLIS